MGGCVEVGGSMSGAESRSCHGCCGFYEPSMNASADRYRDVMARVHSHGMLPQSFGTSEEERSLASEVASMLSKLQRQELDDTLSTKLQECPEIQMSLRRLRRRSCPASVGGGYKAGLDTI